jgi:hypothetical protein
MEVQLMSYDGRSYSEESSAHPLQFRLTTRGTMWRPRKGTALHLRGGATHHALRRPGQAEGPRLRGNKPGRRLREPPVTSAARPRLSSSAFKFLAEAS